MSFWISIATISLGFLTFVGISVLLWNRRLWRIAAKSVLASVPTNKWSHKEALITDIIEAENPDLKALWDSQFFKLGFMFDPKYSQLRCKIDTIERMLEDGVQEGKLHRIIEVFTPSDSHATNAYLYTHVLPELWHVGDVGAGLSVTSFNRPVRRVTSGGS